MALKKMRVSKKKIKKSDEFLDHSNKIFIWLHDNWKFFILFAVVMVVVFLASYAYTKKKAQKEKGAFIEFYKGMTAYKKLTPESSEGAIAEVYNLFEDIAKNFAGKKGADYAELYLGHTYYKDGEYEKAVKVYQNISNRYNKDSVLNVIAKEGLAYSYLGLKKYKNAIDVFEKIVSSSMVFSKKNLYLTIADAYENMDDKTSAANTLEKVLEEFPDDPENDSIKERLSGLIQH